MTVQWRLWLGFGVTFILLSAITVIGHYQAKQISVSERWVAHTYEVLAALETMISGLKDAETGQRGYLLTSDESYLEPYDSALINAPARFHDLQKLIADNPQQKKRVVQMGILANKKLTELAETIQLHQSGRAGAALALVRTDLGKQLMGEIRVLIKEIKTDEKILLEKRQALSTRTTHFSQWLVSVGSFLILLAAALVVYITSKNIGKDHAQL